jgi:hypothetical protein
VQLNNFTNFGIYGNNVTRFTLANSTINGTNGTTNAGDGEEDSVRFDNLLGSGSITGSSISGGFNQNVDLYNTSGTLDRLTLNNDTFGLVNSTGGNDNVRLQAFNSATANITLTNSNFLGTRADFFAALDNNNTTMDVVARGNTFHNGQAIIPGGGTAVDVRGGSGGNNSTATTTFDISNNTDSDGGANAFDTVGIFVAKGQDLGTMVGTIQGNTLLGQTGSNSDGIFVREAGHGTLTTLIQNNTITGVGDAGIALQNNDGSATMNATLYGNTVSSPTSSSPFAALDVENGATASDTSTTNVVIGTGTGGAGSKNTLNHASNYATDVELSNFNGNTHLNLSKNGSTSSTAVNVIRDDNNSTTGIITVDTTGGTGATTLVSTLPTLPPVVAPLLAAPGGVQPSGPTDQPPPGAGDPPPGGAPAPSPISTQLTQSALAPILAQAIAAWEATGLTAEQATYLQGVTVGIADLGGVTLGAASTGHVTLDDNAAGNGWYIDPTPGDNAEFPNAVSATELLTTAGLAPAGHVDLLTTVEHELGHELGLNDTYDLANRDSLMFGTIVDGERRLPAAGEANGATPGNIVGQDFALGSVALGTLPAGKSVTVSFQATVDPQSNQLIVNPQNHGTVSSSAPFQGRRIPTRSPPRSTA